MPRGLWQLLRQSESVEKNLTEIKNIHLLTVSLCLYLYAESRFITAGLLIKSLIEIIQGSG